MIPTRYAHAEALVRAAPDVIFAVAATAVKALQWVTRTIPIVLYQTVQASIAKRYLIVRQVLAVLAARLKPGRTPERYSRGPRQARFPGACARA
jgi:hypothetical protein